MTKVAAMMPEQFWSLSPFEAGCIVSGGAFRDEREWERAAFVAACTMNASGNLKKPVTPAQLLGKLDRVVPKDPGAELEAMQQRAKKLAQKPQQEG